ncbi:bifunctional NAD(P)H-hydrate repair enzyme [Tersicoccus solisilvae]|uniref:Bifunctional NAD(P)H-hydrate repair enzyme n=1 Tax=Tersicoccus solisilvae TaxID=1882339 RepID=A0ABQ1NVG5_9MICC|nr:bifunctional ADP-dependent NAD(P)H-hydrate dehydratase/NAD(P)H-hydrate epimerase [Tersicoccus solisilvae]GGC85876.1 bifunctional NAD(P)H-hydrate repair enzyme [Tersicoccus solisilvae]
MLNAWTGAQIRAAEAPRLDAGAGDALMRRAAHGLAGAALALLDARRRPRYGARVVALAGSGNNGGDALWAAALLARRGLRPAAILVADRAHEPGLADVHAAGGDVVRLADDDASTDAARRLLADADVVIDGILGTGASGGLREPAAGLAAHLEDLRRTGVVTVLACDIASGIDADTGEAPGEHVTADATATFGGAKVGHLAGAGEAARGTLTVVPLGIEADLPDPDLRRLQTAELRALWPTPARSAQKYSRGVLGVVAGSAQYPGAALLTTAAAAAAGVGMVRYLGPEAVGGLINARTPDAVCSAQQPGDVHVQAWLVGPGTNDDEAQLDRVRTALAAAVRTGTPAVVDAGGMSVLPEQGAAHLVLTPHAGELARLLSDRHAADGAAVERSDVEARPLHHARLAARITGCTVLLKGATTLVAGPDGTAFSQADATPWLSTAGSGDVLAGILGAVLAGVAEHPRAFDDRGLGGDVRWAAAAAVAASLHGRAGRTAARDPEGTGAGGPIHATAVIDALAAAVRDVLAG